MRSVSIFLFLVVQGINLFAQQSDTLYFKDKWLAKPTSEKKAKFCEVTTKDGEIEKQTIYSVPDNDLVLHTEKKGDFPVGVWTDNRFSHQVFDYRFKLIYSDERIEGGIYPELDNDTNVEKAFFPGGMQEFYHYVMKTLTYPSYARRNGIQGKVYLHVKVTSQGDIQFLSIYKGVDKFLDQEAARVIVQCSDWIPAKKNGEPIDSYYIIPITFRLA